MKALIIAVVCGVAIALAACTKADGGHQRGLFTGSVMDKTPEEVEGKYGKPASVDSTNPNIHRWVYKRITFDPDNSNQVDNETVLIMQKGKDGKFKVTQVVFG